MLIDTHAHLNLAPLEKDWQKYLNLAEAAGVIGVIVPGIDAESSKLAVTLSRLRKNLYAAVGIHPEVVKSTSLKLPDSLEEIVDLVKTQKIVGIGEVGLDYNSLDVVEVQRQLFREQLALAKAYGLPVIIHTRRSQAMHDAIDDINTVYGQAEFKGVFHCFSGGAAHLKRMLERGAYIGIGGLTTYSHNSSLNKVIRTIPLNRIVLETDAPWLVPEPKTEEYNQPAYVTITALKLAELLSAPIDRICAQTTYNAQELFGLR